MTHLDNDEDFISSLEDFVDDILAETQPLLDSKTRGCIAKERARIFFRDVLSCYVKDIKTYSNDNHEEEVDKIIKIHEKEKEELEGQVEEQNSHIKDLFLEVNDLQSTVDDLTMKLDQPGKWYGKKFGL